MPTSIKRALLISSPRKGLIATGPSLVRMRDFLGRQGFVITDDQCIDGDRANRATIVAGFDALIEATGPHDIVVVYYAGHGGLFHDTSGATTRSYPMLEPMDLADSDPAHFNGLLGGELRLFIRALARLCDNVTAIFDCCHAAGLLDTNQPPRASDEATDRAAIAAVAIRAGERIARRRAEAAAGHDPTRSDGDPASTGAVRLVASSASERAYAYPDRPMLLFTDILVTVLEQHALAQGLTWEQIIRLVRAQVQKLRPEQRPGVEGASNRRPFTTEGDATPVEYFHVQQEGSRLRLAAGRTAGIRLHERFELLPYAGHDGASLGTAQAHIVRPSHAFLDVPRDQHPLPDLMLARRVRTGALELAAHLATADLPADRCRAAELQATLTAGGHRLRDSSTSHTPSGHIDLLDDLNPDGPPGFTPRLVARVPLSDPNSLDDLTRAVRRLERWAGLAAEIGHVGLGPLAGCYTLTWGRLIGGELAPLRDGRVLQTGEPLALQVHNPGHASVLHLQAYRVRADRSVQPWRDVDGGLAIKTKKTLELQETFEPLAGLPDPQHEWLVVAIGDGAFDLGALTTPMRDRPRGPVLRSSDRHPGEASRVEIFGFPYILAPAP